MDGFHTKRLFSHQSKFFESFNIFTSVKIRLIMKQLAGVLSLSSGYNNSGGAACNMGKVLSENTKYELAKELGFADKVKNGDYGNITTREAGLMVREAIKIAEDVMAERNEMQ